MKTLLNIILSGLALVYGIRFPSGEWDFSVDVTEGYEFKIVGRLKE